MANILVAFFNGIKDEENPNAMSAYYEGFIKGLDEAGNSVLVFTCDELGTEFLELPETLKQSILAFAPDICFLFNNAFYDLSEVVDCPLVIWESDIPQYFSNQKVLRKNPDRFLYAITQNDSRNYLIKEYGIEEKYIFQAPYFTEIRADSQAKKTVNISFVGSRFLVDGYEPYRAFMKGNPTKEEWEMYRSCVMEIKKNPYITPKELVYQCMVTSELVAKNLCISNILSQLSGERRIRVLSAVADLGLNIYGLKDWREDYYCCTDLNFSYVDRNVYSICHNQEVLNHSRIGINVGHLQSTSDFSWRVWEIMASSACLVTEYYTGLDRLFPELKGVIPIYDNPCDAYYICKQLLEDEPRRKEIVERCNAVIDERYRMKHAILQLEEATGVMMHS